jgi:hypothetical protein
VGEDGGDGETTGALDVHEEGSRGGHKGLELVLLSLSGRGRVQKINGENLKGGALANLFHHHVFILCVFHPLSILSSKSSSINL